ncbi:MAG: YggT family protein [Patescibacteria group bacterium]
MEYVTTSDARVRPLYRGTQVVWYILNVLEALLLFRFVLKLLGANAAAGFTSFIYSLSYPFVAPFLNVFRVSKVAGSTFEWTTLLAMFVYWLIAWAIVRLIVMNKPVTTNEARSKLNKQDVEV